MKKYVKFSKVQIDNIFQRKIVNIFSSISFNICFGAQKNHLNETVLLSSHNISFRWEKLKLIFDFTLLSKSADYKVAIKIPAYPHNLGYEWQMQENTPKKTMGLWASIIGNK